MILKEEVFQWKEQKGISFGFFPRLSESGIITHGFSSRKGGVSEGVFSTMNLAYNSDDDPVNVRENYYRFTSALGVDWRRAVLTHQTHQSRILRVMPADWGKGLLRPRDFEAIDGLITDVPGLPLMSFHADCLPLYYVDPAGQSIGMGHAGWRGTVENLAGKMVSQMTLEFGTKPSDLIVAIGPSIQSCCFLIRDDVWHQMRNSPFIPCEELICQTNDQWSVSLQRINRIQLEEAGVLSANIVNSGICTACNPEFLFSHRIQGLKRGTMAALIQLNSKYHAK